MPMYIIIITYLSCVLIIVKIPFNFKFQKPKKRLGFFCPCYTNKNNKISFLDFRNELFISKRGK
jgi:hypothetical protein